PAIHVTCACVLVVAYALVVSLFPYTTLFRSAREVVARVAGRELEARGEHVPSLRLLRPGGQVLDRLRRVRLEEVLVRLPGGDLRDRKSTRLNSSHVKNSYAVFCLKKKKTQTT